MKLYTNITITYIHDYNIFTFLFCSVILRFLKRDTHSWLMNIFRFSFCEAHHVVFEKLSIECTHKKKNNINKGERISQKKNSKMLRVTSSGFQLVVRNEQSKLQVVELWINKKRNVEK